MCTRSFSVVTGVLVSLYNTDGALVVDKQLIFPVSRWGIRAWEIRVQRREVSFWASLFTCLVMCFFIIFTISTCFFIIFTTYWSAWIELLVYLPLKIIIGKSNNILHFFQFGLPQRLSEDVRCLVSSRLWQSPILPKKVVILLFQQLGACFKP